MSTYGHNEIEEYLKKYGDMVYRLAYIHVKTKEQTDDIYQDVFLKLLQQKERHVGEEHLKSWLIRTTINCCKDYWKSAWFRKRASMEEVSEMPTEIDMDSDIAKKDSLKYVTDCVRRLPTKYRQIIHLYYYEQYSQKEIADILGINENTVATRMVRGRHLLKKYLDKENIDYEI